MTTALLSGLFWGGYFAGGGQLEASALPLTFLHPDGPPAWVRDFSTAFCRGDVPYVTAHLAGRYAGLDETMVNEQLDSMRMNAGDCVAVRYLGALSGSEGARQYVYVFDFTSVDARRSVWFVFTTMSGRVVNIE